MLEVMRFENWLNFQNACAIQFQFQFFTLTLKNSDKTKSWGVDCDRANLD